MAVTRRYAMTGQLRCDLPALRTIESAASADFDTFIQAFATGAGNAYVMRGFNISMANAIGGAASSLRLVVASGALLHPNASQSGTFYMVPSGTPSQQLNSVTNPLVTGAFTPNATNYVGLDYERYNDDTTSVQSYFWDPATKTEITKNVPQATILRYRIRISTITPGNNILPIAIVTTNSGNNVQSIKDCRNLFGRLGRGGFSGDPFYVYPWVQTKVENPSSSTSNTVDPFYGADKSIGSVKDALDAIMTEIKSIKGTPFWYSTSSSGSLESLRQDLANTVITGRGTITHSATVAGRLNWSDDIKIQVVGSRLSYVLEANPSTTDITLTDERVAYITLVRGADVTPNLIFDGTDEVTSVGSVSWTTNLQAGDFIKVASDTDDQYYEIDTVDSTSQVTLTTTYTGTQYTGTGIEAKYAYGTYETNPSPSTTRHIHIANREAVPRTEDTFWLYMRSDNGGATPRIYVRFLGMEIEQGESEDISDTTSHQLLEYIGSPMESASAPQYVSALNAGSVAEITDLTFPAASSISSGQYFLINSSGNSRRYYVWFNKDASGIDPEPGVAYTGVEVAISTGNTNVQVATAVRNALNATDVDDFTATLVSTATIRATNTSAGACVDASNNNVGGMSLSVVQQGTGTGNYTIIDGDNLTLAIKKLDNLLGSLISSLDDPSYDEAVDIGSTITAGTTLTIPVNTRMGSIQQKYTVGNGTLQIYLNGQYQRLGVDWDEVGTSGTAATEITIQRGLISGDTLEYRISAGGGGAGGSGGVGPTGAAGPPGSDAIGGPINISTKSSNYTVLLTDNVLLVDTTSGNVTLTLPTSLSSGGRVFWFKKISADGNSMILKGNGSENIDTANTKTTTVQGQSYTVVSDLTQFWLI